ncbi:MAG: endonuclease V [Candidatus Thermoplasmatota archaeon]
MIDLKALRNEQIKLRKKVKIYDEFEDITAVGGVDVAYSEDFAYGACLVYNGQDITSYTIKRKIDFPYIPTYLAYREAPIIIDLLKRVKKIDLLMVDGNGILHPYRFGIASHVGVLLDMPTIGIAKSLLCGREQRGKIMDGKEQIGYILHTKNRKVYISPGHKVSMESSLKIVKEIYSKIELINEAHKLANTVKKNDRPWRRETSAKSKSLSEFSNYKSKCLYP